MHSQSIALRRPAEIRAEPNETHHGHPRGIRPFVGHFVEMTVAMMVGMALFGMPLRALLGLMLGPSVVRVPELRALGMALAMTLAMVLWMRFRRHSWRATAEMAAAMIVPALALLPALWLGMISGDVLTGLVHILMLPSMLAAMVYRRGAYGL